MRALVAGFLSTLLALSLPTTARAAAVVEASRTPGRAPVLAVPGGVSGLGSEAPALTPLPAADFSAIGALSTLAAPPAVLPAFESVASPAPRLAAAAPAVSSDFAARPAESALASAPAPMSLAAQAPIPSSLGAARARTDEEAALAAPTTDEGEAGRRLGASFHGLSLALPSFSRMGEGEAAAEAHRDFMSRAGLEQGVAAAADRFGAAPELGAFSTASRPGLESSYSAVGGASARATVPAPSTLAPWRAAARSVFAFAPFTAALTMVSGALAAFPPLGLGIAFMAVMIPSFVLHEMAHAKVADALGDPTPRLEGRLSFRPKDLLTHIHPVLTVALPIATLAFSLYTLGVPVILAGARPLGFVPQHLAEPSTGRSENKGNAAVAIAGPATHLAITVGLALLHLGLVAAGVTGLPAAVVALALFFNVLYMLFNLFPLMPLDGHHVARWILAEPLRMPGLADLLFGPLVDPPKGLLVILRDPDALRSGLDAWDRGLRNSDAPLSLELAEDLENAGLFAASRATYRARVAAADPALNAVFLQVPEEKQAELEDALARADFRYYPGTMDGFKRARAELGAHEDSPVVKGFSAPFNQSLRRAIHYFVLGMSLWLLSGYLLAAVKTVSALFLMGSGVVAP